MGLEALQTPALLLDVQRLEANCARMIERCRALGTRLRPHMKTMKSIDVAKRAIDPEHGGITVSTLHEAEYFAGHGARDILHAVCITPDKFDRAAAIAERIERLGLFVDDPRLARELARHGGRFDCWIEIDSGEHRTGLLPDATDLVEIGRIVEQASNLTLRGAATHAGHSYGCDGADAIREVARQERDAVLTARARLEAAGIACPETSIGSTPTACFLDDAAGISEIRAGVYQAGDLVQWQLGSCGFDDIALSVLATVISHKRDCGQIVIDAGGLALSKDGGTGQHGYGRVVDAHGEGLPGEPVVARVYQEHGLLEGASDALFEALPIGARVLVLPNHACMTAAMYGEYQLVGEGGAIVGSWQRTNGW